VPVGGSLIFNYPEDSAARLLVRVDEETFVAYEQQCTHLTCPVIPAVEEGELHCPCHEGIFDLLTGRPLAGPPRRPLARVTLEVREGTIYATGMEARTT
jgi:Rieske Fe-S protein